MKKRCPATDCSGGNADRQIDFHYETANKLPESVKEFFRGAVSKPMRCTYCSCVYNSKRRFGFFNSGVLGQGWHGPSTL